MRALLGTYPAEFYYSNLRPHKCRTRNYVSTSAENGPAMAGPAGPVPAPMFEATFSFQITLPVNHCVVLSLKSRAPDSWSVIL